MASSTAYWCSGAAVQESGQRRTYALGGLFVETAEAAMEWLCARLMEIAEQLDPPALSTVAAWLREPAGYAEGIAELHIGRSVAVDLSQDQVCYTVGVRAVRGAVPPAAPWSAPGSPLLAAPEPQRESPTSRAVHAARR